jgi:putative glutamine amidotransferase
VPLKDAWIGDRIRDLYDLALVEAFEQAGKPIFGVCRGLQLINVAFGGTLYQDIEAQHGHPETLKHRDPVTYDQNFHQIELVQGTRLSKLYPDLKTARVNSIHHQGVKDIAPGFDIEAWSLPDRVPEAIRRRADRGRSYIAATQWHPEFHKYGSTETVDDTPILHDFLWACATARVAPRTSSMRGMPGRIRNRAARLLKQALLRR